MSTNKTDRPADVDQALDCLLAAFLDWEDTNAVDNRKNFSVYSDAQRMENTFRQYVDDVINRHLQTYDWSLLFAQHLQKIDNLTTWRRIIPSPDPDVK